jgi:long-chain acyl-CoA synthetase
MQAQGESSPLKSKIFKWAMSVGYKVSEARIQKKSPDLATLMEYRIAKRLVFDKFYEKLGGKLRFAVSGGAPLSGEIARFFHAAGLLILEGYGLTETTAAVLVNTPYDYKFGTVGKPIGDVQVKFAEDGEILVRSKKVMRGYYKNPKATEDVFDDQDYFKTGDIGELDAQGFLRITDRKKDLIKTAGGKFVAPQKLENLLKLNKNISNVLIHGDKKKYIVSLVTLNQERIVEFAKQHMISFPTFEELSKHPKVKDLIRNAVAQANSALASFETIKNFAILPTDFTIETGELTPSLKVKRKFCDQKFEAEIRALYGDDQAS